MYSYLGMSFRLWCLELSFFYQKTTISARFSLGLF